MTTTDELRTNWQAMLPNIFSEARFRQKSHARFYASLNGKRAGIAVAFRTASYDNYALNNSDLARLLELRRAGTFDEAFVVAAKRAHNALPVYVGSCEAEEVQRVLAGVPLCSGPFGDYWLLREDLAPLTQSAIADDDVPF